MERWWQGSDHIAQEIITRLGKRRCSFGNWDYNIVKYSISGDIAEVKLDDPATGNGLTNKMVSALTDIAVELHGRPDVKVVVFTAGGFYFCTGGAFGGGVPEDDVLYGPQFEPGMSDYKKGVIANLPIARLLYLLNTMPQFKVCSIRGGNLGAGISIIASMDYVIAPERKTALSFKEAARGLAACSSWQGIISKIGVLRMRSLCLISEELDVHRAKDLGLVDEILPGPVASSLKQADDRAFAKAEEIAQLSPDERVQLKTTGPLGCPNRLLPVPAAVRKIIGNRTCFQHALNELLSSYGHRGRPGPARLSQDLWFHEGVHLEMAGQSVAVLTLQCNSSCSLNQPTVDGLLEALIELHASVGRVRVLCVRLQTSSCCKEEFCPVRQVEEVLFLMYMLPMFVLGNVEGDVAGLGLVLSSTFDALVADRGACFCFSGLSLTCPGVSDFLVPRLQLTDVSDLVATGTKWTADKAQTMGLVTIAVEGAKGFQRELEKTCEKVSKCAPNAVAQSKAFLQKIGTFPIDTTILEELCAHVSCRQLDPEFQDSIRAIADKSHVPMYSRPNSRVVPQHNMATAVKDSSGYPAQHDGTPHLDADGTILI